ncbi:hypothetical protein [Spiroplasma chrysopicola]|uniref:Lipoprotein n=1 Tax=Spiroplasma chrysopicola DF-1 TaxID=1276227 RepID=R4UH23_9MOLU|nr:hypothetical protein [Spiroplasma chrysopicola]AGM25470.1 hypothetical protein SCHRY_v1c08970 [Spiroplasma chrysopicola DF-1]
MKKLVVMFTAVSMITTTSSLAVSCSTDRNLYVLKKNKVVFNKYNFQLDEDCIYATLILGNLYYKNTDITSFISSFKDNSGNSISYLKIKEELPVQDKYDKRIYHFTIVRDSKREASIQSETSCNFSFWINNTLDFSGSNLKTRLTILPAPLKLTQS